MTWFKFSKKLTFVEIVFDDVLDITLLSSINSLILEVLALSTHAVGGIHALLELVILPSKDVVTVLTESCIVTIAEVEWVGFASLPLRVEGRCIPDNLVHKLRDADGMRGRAVST